MRDQKYRGNVPVCRLGNECFGVVSGQVVEDEAEEIGGMAGTFAKGSLIGVRNSGRRGVEKWTIS
jgi:hypothetical protein